MSDNETLSIDLTRPWTNVTVTISTINKTVPVWVQSYLWPDSRRSSFYQWGGYSSYRNLDLNTAASALYKFQPDNRGGGEWSEQGQTPTSNFNTLRRGSNGGATSRGESWYVLGGLATCRSDPRLHDCNQPELLGGIIEYNSTSNLWTNDSVQGFTESGTPLWSQMHNVPYGSSDGLNVIFGGGTASSLNMLSGADPSDLLDFEHIYIYDPATKTFHNQTATGTLPTPRLRFCSVGTPGFNGSYDIFIYGGYRAGLSDQQFVRASDEVYVLSLPGFVWFKADYPATSARHMHSCDIVGHGGSQMVVTGGVDPTARDGPTESSRDPWTNGINIFDLSAMRWKDAYDPNDAPYQTPSVIRDWYTENGPYPSWDYPAVQSLFIAAPTPTSRPSTPSTPPAKKHPNTGAIAGGIAGGGALVAVIVAVLCCALKRRKHYSQKSEYHKPELEASTVTDSRQPMDRRQLVSNQDFPGGPMHELPSERRSHDASSRERYEVA